MSRTPKFYTLRVTTRPFADLDAARTWVERFARWYQGARGRSPTTRSRTAV